MPNLFVGVDGISRKITKLYCGVDGISRKITKLYCGVDGISRKLWSSGIPAGMFNISYQKIQRPENGKVITIQGIDINGGILSSVAIAAEWAAMNIRFNSYLCSGPPTNVGGTENEFFVYGETEKLLRFIDPRTGAVLRAYNFESGQCGAKGGLGPFFFNNWFGPDVNADNQEKPPATTTPYRSIWVNKHDAASLAYISNGRVKSSRAWHDINRRDDGKASGATGGWGSIVSVNLIGHYDDDEVRTYTALANVDINSWAVISYPFGTTIWTASSTTIWPNYSSDLCLADPSTAMRARFDGSSAVFSGIRRDNKDSNAWVANIPVYWSVNAVSVGNK